MRKPPVILVVEDEFIVAFELRTALERMGYVVCGTASSGEEAIELAGRELPDFVLMDVSLKGRMDGIEAARHIVSRHGIRVAFLSGYPSDETLERAADLDPVCCFVKPVEHEQLEAVLVAYFLKGPKR